MRMEHVDRATRERQARDKAFLQGVQDFGRGVKRTRPPYGFTDLKDAWRKGWDRARKGLALTIGA